MWIEPKICREDGQGAKQLPSSGTKEECPPCNPGMHPNGTGMSECVYCPVKHFSDGKAGMYYNVWFQKISIPPPRREVH